MLRRPGLAITIALATAFGSAVGCGAFSADAEDDDVPAKPDAAAVDGNRSSSGSITADGAVVMPDSGTVANDSGAKPDDGGLDPCVPAALDVTCAAKCGSVFDNCGHEVACPGCGTGTCVANTCVPCVPASADVTCGAKQCGSAVNNCGQTVSCGASGACAGAATCMPDQTCCTDNGQACAGRCGGTAVNNCGKAIDCPSVSCQPGQACFNGSCCVRNMGACLNQCSGEADDGCGGKVSCFKDCDVLCSCHGGLCNAVTRECQCINMPGPCD